MSDSLRAPAPQFGTAEYPEASGPDKCRFCQQAIAGPYYRMGGNLACRSCAEKAYDSIPVDSSANFVRGLIFGIGAAIAGLILYAAFEIGTGWIIGYISLAVGWMVGKAMMKGSGGHGGRHYQIAAALLTYAAVSMAAIPIGIHYATQHQQQPAKRQKPGDGQRQLDRENGQAAAPARSSLYSGKFFLRLAWIGLASPFMELADPVRGLIGLFILFIGIRIAWQMTALRRPAIDGPFNAPQPSPTLNAG